MTQVSEVEFKPVYDDSPEALRRIQMSGGNYVPVIAEFSPEQIKEALDFAKGLLNGSPVMRYGATEVVEVAKFRDGCVGDVPGFGATFGAVLGYAALLMSGGIFENIHVDTGATVGSILIGGLTGYISGRKLRYHVARRRAKRALGII